MKNDPGIEDSFQALSVYYVCGRCKTLLEIRTLRTCKRNKVYRKLPRITNEPWIYWWRTVCHETALNIIKIQKKRLTKVALFNRSQFSLVQATGCAYSSSSVLLLGKTESNSSTSGCTVVVPMFEHLGHAQSPPRKGGIDTRHSLRYLW